MLWNFRIPFLALFFGTTAGFLWGQIERSTIEGTVTDIQGAVIAGAAVTVTSQGTNVVSPTKTNGSGYYQVIGLVPGKYTVKIESPGFKVTEGAVQTQAGQNVRFDATLAVGSSEQQVEVMALAPVLETGSSNYSTSISQQTVDDTPLPGRDLQQLIFQIPGVANVAGPPGSNFGFSSQYGTFPDPSNAQGSDISVNGGQGGANAWYLDGNLNLSGLVENMAVNPSPDAVTEFQAITDAISA